MYRQRHFDNNSSLISHRKQNAENAEILSRQPTNPQMNYITKSNRQISVLKFMRWTLIELYLNLNHHFFRNQKQAARLRFTVEKLAFLHFRINRIGLEKT